MLCVALLVSLDNELLGNVSMLAGLALFEVFCLKELCDTMQLFWGLSHCSKFCKA